MAVQLNPFQKPVIDISEAVAKMKPIGLICAIQLDQLMCPGLDSNPGQVMNEIEGCDNHLMMDNTYILVVQEIHALVFLSDGRDSHLSGRVHFDPGEGFVAPPVLVQKELAVGETSLKFTDKYSGILDFNFFLNNSHAKYCLLYSYIIYHLIYFVVIELLRKDSSLNLVKSHHNMTSISMIQRAHIPSLGFFPYHNIHRSVGHGLTIMSHINLERLFRIFPQY